MITLQRGFVNASRKVNIKSTVTRRMVDYTPMFNFMWSDTEWMKRNVETAPYWSKLRDSLSNDCHLTRTVRMQRLNVNFKKVEPLQLFAFEQVFFDNRNVLSDAEDIDFETEQANVLMYKS